MIDSLLSAFDINWVHCEVQTLILSLNYNEPSLLTNTVNNKYINILLVAVIFASQNRYDYYEGTTPKLNR